MPLWSGLDSEIVGTCKTSFQCFLTYNVAHWRHLQLKNPNFFLFWNSCVTQLMINCPKLAGYIKLPQL